MKKQTLNILIINLIVTLVIWGGYFFWIKYIENTNSSFDEVKHKIIFATQKSDAIKRLRNQIQNDTNNGFDLDTFIVHPDQTADIVQKIESFGGVTKTKINTQSVATEESPSLPAGSNLLRIVFNINGTKENILNCIRLVEMIPYNSKITKLNLSKISNASSTDMWSANVDLIMVKLSDSGGPDAVK